MKKTLFALALLSLNLSSYSSDSDKSNAEKAAHMVRSASSSDAKRAACIAAALLLPVTALGGPAVFSAACSAWAEACVKPNGSPSTAIIYSKKW